MNTTIRSSNKCIIERDPSGVKVEAEVLEFAYQVKLVVVLNKTVKVHMKWNGKRYESTQAGMNFISDGPEVIKSTVGARGGI